MSRDPSAPGASCQWTAAVGTRRHLKRGRLPAASAAACGVAGDSDSAAQRDRRWINPERRRRFRTLKPQRRWIDAEDARSPPKPPGDTFVVMSYNILGVNNALNHRDLYWNIPCDTMNWDLRRGLICQEISRWNPDFTCLQEVDRFHDILAYMRKNGHAGSYKGRSGDAKDGCAIFWKEKRFRLLEEHTIDFSAYDLRNNVAQLLVFEGSETRRLVLGNIHVLFNPKRGDIKLGQIRMLIAKANAISTKWGGIPVVLAGDFNSTPESAIYKFLSTTELNISLHDRRHLSGLDSCQFGLYGLPSFLKHQWTNEEMRNATGCSKSMQVKHPLNLRSSYASVRGNAKTRGPHGEPVATSHHSKFLGTVDYLWYSTGFSCSRVLDTLPVDILRKMGGLLTKENGSDHLALVAEFIFEEPSESKPRAEPKHQHTTNTAAEK